MVREINITDKMLLSARKKATEMGRLHNSISRGAGNLCGFLGEAIALKALKGVENNTYEYDIVLDNGETVDVKSKHTSVAPLGHYDCSVSNHNIKQECDYYAFVRVKMDYSKGWFLGVIRKKDFFDEAYFATKGEVDPDNGYTVRSDCYQLKIDALRESDYVKT
jgi:hypothetical protein